jgi:hypothetical protein
MMLTVCALGVEVSEARDHLSIAAAGEIDGGFVLVELAAYVDGTDPVAEVPRLQAERTVLAVAVDPHSPAATVIKPLTDAEVEVVELSTHDVAVATASSWTHWPLGGCGMSAINGWMLRCDKVRPGGWAVRRLGSDVVRLSMSARRWRPKSPFGHWDTRAPTVRRLNSIW